MVIKLKSIIKLTLILTFSLLITVNPDICVESALKGIKTFTGIVFPSLFPFMVVSKYLIYSNLGEKVAEKLTFFSKIFNLPKISSVAFLLGSLSGFPTGASIICDLYNDKQLSKKDAEKMMGFCSNSGPLFLIATVGFCLFKSKKIGYFLYFVHFVSALLTGFFTRSKEKIKDCSFKHGYKNISPFTNAVTDSVYGLLSIFGFIIIFSVILGYLKIFIKNSVALAVVSSVLEISTGFSELSLLKLPKALKLCLISAFSGFSGICIIFQTLSIIKKSGLDIKPYIKNKIIFSIIAFVLCLVLIYVLNMVGISESLFK